MEPRTKCGIIIMAETLVVLAAFTTPTAILVPDSPLGGITAIVVALSAVGVAMLLAIYTCKRFWHLTTWREAWVEFKKS
jgi:hypothetical protein